MTDLVRSLLMVAQRGHNVLRARREQRTLICPSCRVEYAKNARCCIRCGSQVAITVAELNQRDAAETAATDRLLAAKHSYDVLLTQSYCSHCRQLLPKTIDFCPACIERCVSPPPAELVFATLHTHFPDLVSKPDDLRRVANTHMPLERQILYLTGRAAGAGWNWFRRNM